MPEVVDWQSVADPYAVVRRAAQTLRAGGVVAFPTETSYALAADGLSADAVRRACTASAGPNAEPLLLGVRGAGEARAWVPGMSLTGRRLARRCWPGPVTLAFRVHVTDCRLSMLPREVRERLCGDGWLRLRVPAHEAILAVLGEFDAPLTLAAGPGRAADVGAGVELVLDDGTAPAGVTPTVVEVSGESWRLARAGAVSADELARQAARQIVFVCTGNTCRSPLAEALFKKRLAERLGCGVGGLPARGFAVLSAGLAAMPGGPAMPEAVEAARELGGDLSGHRSQPLTAELAAHADYLVVMTHGHAQLLTDHYPQLGAPPRLLDPGGGDIADPIGCPRDVYQACGRQIWDCLDALLAEVQP